MKQIKMIWLVYQKSMKVVAITLINNNDILIKFELIRVMMLVLVPN
jgi:hypothetical protein